SGRTGSQQAEACLTYQARVASDRRAWGVSPMTPREQHVSRNVRLREGRRHWLLMGTTCGNCFPGSSSWYRRLRLESGRTGSQQADACRSPGYSVRRAWGVSPMTPREQLQPEQQPYMPTPVAAGPTANATV